MMRLRPITGADSAWLEPEFEAYLAEVAPGLTLGPLNRWWQEAEREALVIEAPEVAGFAMVRRDDDGHWDFSEFYIRPEVRRRGIGRAAARAILAARPGKWSLGVVRHGGARVFWSGLLREMAADLTEHPPLTEVQALSYRFTIAGEAHA